METTTTTTTMKKIIDFFGENEDIFNSCIEELDAYNGYLGDDRYYDIDFLNELFTDCNNIDLLNRAFFGRDDDTWTTDGSGNKKYGEFNPNREYFYFNGYGNLVSSDYKDYSAHLDAYAVDAMRDARQWIDTIEDNEELSQLFDELENE